MALIQLESWDDGLWNKPGKWDTISGVTNVAAGAGYPNGRNGKGGGLTRGDATGLRKILPAAMEHATLILGCAFKCGSAYGEFANGGTYNDGFRFGSDAAGTWHIAVVPKTSGVIGVYRVGNTTPLGITGGGIWLMDTWHYIEVKATLHDTTGTVQVKLDGATVLNLTGQDTKNGGTKTVFDAVNILVSTSVGGNPIVCLDDIYICNGAGAVNNDFMGDIKVEALFPNGNGNSSGLTGSDANSVDNYLLVDDALTPDDDTTYAESSVDGTKDTYAFSNLVTTTGTIKGVQIGNYSRRDTSGAKSSRSVTRTGAVDYPGADQVLASSYADYLEIQDVNPGTSAAWTIAEINAAEFGVEVRP